MKHKRGIHPEDELRLARTELQRHCATVEIVDISDSTRTLSLALRGLKTLLTGSALTVDVFRSASFRAKVREVMRAVAIDTVHLDTISLAQYLDEVGSVPAVMTHHGAESFMIRRRVRLEQNPILKLFFLAEWRALRRYEQKICPRVAINTVVSAADQNILAEIAPESRFVVIENGVDVDYFKPAAPSSSRSLIFAGRLDQYSNRASILYFVREIWPLVHKSYPDAVLNVLGSNPPEQLVAAAQSDSAIRVHGFVPDVRPYFRDASVAICPIRDGGGTRIKVLDALAQGLPIVATTMACEGIDAVQGRDLLIADTPAEFAAHIGRIFEEPDLRVSLPCSCERWVRHGRAGGGGGSASWPGSYAALQALTPRPAPKSFGGQPA
jgi:glycosyltransferase involved in cell wall biosynthesis